MKYNSNGDENLQTLYHWKALTKESSLKRLFLKMVHCASLASKEKKIGLEMKLVDQEGDETNWQFRE
jgi:hypothetical protein